MGNEIIQIESRKVFNLIVKQLAGQVFHRTEDGEYFVKPVGKNARLLIDALVRNEDK